MSDVEELARAAIVCGLLTYLRMVKFPLGLLMNFGAPTLNNGLKRVANNYHQVTVFPELRPTADIP